MAQSKRLDPVEPLHKIRSTQHTLSEIAAHGTPSEGVPRSATDVATFLQSLSSAWTKGEVRQNHRKQPRAKHRWRTRTDPFADAWPVIEGWLIAKPSTAAKGLMARLVAMVPEFYIDGKKRVGDGVSPVPVDNGKDIDRNKTFAKVLLRVSDRAKRVETPPLGNITLSQKAQGASSLRELTP